MKFSLIFLLMSSITVYAIIFNYFTDTIFVVIFPLLICGIIIFITWSQFESRKNIVITSILLLQFLNVINLSPISWLPSGFNVGHLRLPILVITVILIGIRFRRHIDITIFGNLDIFVYVIWACIAGVFSPFEKSTALLYGIWLGLSLFLILFLLYGNDNPLNLLFDINRVWLWSALPFILISMLQIQDAIQNNTRLFGILDMEQVVGPLGAIAYCSIIVLRHLGPITARKSILISYPIFVFIITISVVSIIFSGSRGPFIAFVLFTAVYLVFTVVGTSIQKYTAFGIMIVGLLAFSIVVQFIPSRIVERLNSLTNYVNFDNVYRLSNSDQLRFKIWEANLDLVYKHPFTGVGLTNSNKALLLDPSLQRAWGPHGTYIEIISETGIVGGVLFIFIVIRSLSLLINTQLFDNKVDIQSYILLMMMSPLIIAVFESHLTPGQILFFPFWFSILLSRNVARNKN